MKIRHLQVEEVESFIEEIWVPAQREMAAVKEYALIDEIREKGIGYQRSRITDEDSVTYLARQDGQYLGYVTAEIQTPPPIVEQVKECHITELFVREDARRQGIASELLTSVENWGDKRDCENVTLLVHADNHAARELYEASGYSIDRHNMKKSLSAAE